MAFTKRGKAINAARMGNNEKLKSLLDAGVSPDACDIDGDSLLWNAIHGGHSDTVRLLLDAGAKLEDSRPNFGLLHSAASKGKTDIAAMLLEKAPDFFDALTKDGRTPLHVAADNGHPAFVADMIKRGMDPNVRDNNGRTALYYANKEGHVEVVDMLKPYAPVYMQPAAEAPPVGEWSLVGPQQVGRALESAPLGYRLTDVFDFHARERLRIVHNTATQKDTVETVSFDGLGEDAPLKAAFAALRKLGGEADEKSIRRRLDKPSKLQPPGVMGTA